MNPPSSFLLLLHAALDVLGDGPHASKPPSASSRKLEARDSRARQNHSTETEKRASSRQQRFDVASRSSGANERGLQSQSSKGDTFRRHSVAIQPQLSANSAGFAPQNVPYFMPPFHEFAKLQTTHYTVIVRTVKLTLGRALQDSVDTLGKIDLMVPDSGATEEILKLAFDENIDKRHGQISFCDSKKGFVLTCLSDKGILVDSTALTPTSPPHLLEDKSVIKTFPVRAPSPIDGRRNSMSAIPQKAITPQPLAYGPPPTDILEAVVKHYTSPPITPAMSPPISPTSFKGVSAAAAASAASGFHYAPLASSTGHPMMPHSGPFGVGMHANMCYPYPWLNMWQPHTTTTTTTTDDDDDSSSLKGKRKRLLLPENPHASGATRPKRTRKKQQRENNPGHHHHEIDVDVVGESDY